MIAATPEKSRLSTLPPRNVNGGPAGNGSIEDHASRSRLKAAKLWVLERAERAGLIRVARDSSWRQKRLLILGYHGISLTDEHEWCPELYIRPETLRARFQHMRDNGYQVLPLREAVERLRAGTLPPRSVALTFDDGTRDFLVAGVPLLREFGFPATVYVTTYYSAKEVPVFRMACRYLLWVGRGTQICGEGLTADCQPIELHTPEQRDAAVDAIEARRGEIAGGVDDELATLRLLASRVGVDFDRFLAERRQQIMSPAEGRSLPRDLVDVQLHTHRHKVPFRKASFDREIEDNRRVLAAFRPDEQLDAFCYPNGLTDVRFLPWLKEHSIRTGVTCEAGLATATTDPLLLPRLVDSSTLSRLEFEAWLSGVGSLLPMRRGRRPKSIEE